MQVSYILPTGSFKEPIPLHRRVVDGMLNGALPG